MKWIEVNVRDPKLIGFIKNNWSSKIVENRNYYEIWIFIEIFCDDLVTFWRGFHKKCTST